MSSPTPFTLAQYDTLKAAIALGVKRVVYSSAPGVTQLTEYGTVAEMMQVLQLMERELAYPASPPRSVFYSAFDRSR